ncbi:MAG TPA: hypothetical protein VMC41_04370 [Candidatus Nanoarchaeia archaeon]|nr:hypothetical protein [Candidatus Nanoarchaeia archaeon]
MKKILKRVAVLFGLLGFLILPYFVFASSPIDALQNVGAKAGYASANSTTISSIAGLIVNSVLSLLGIIFIILIVYAGIVWMTSSGDEAKIEKAQKILRNSIIGLIITVSAFAIYNLVIQFMVAAPGGGPI